VSEFQKIATQAWRPSVGPSHGDQSLINKAPQIDLDESQVFKEREGVVFFLVVMGLPLFFLSGISWPMESIPESIRLIALLIPSTTAISAFVQVDQMGAGLNEVADSILIELALAVGYTILALGLMKFGQKK